jgi:two-component system NarL family sensor kinase
VRSRLATAGGVLALIRLAAIPLFFAAERLVDHPVQNSEPFGPLLVVAAAYAVLALAMELGDRSLARPGVLAVLDLVLISALVASSGGPFSQLRYAFFLLPIGAALLLRPRATALASVSIVVAYAIITLTFPGDEDVRPDAAGFEVTQGLFLAWMGAAATLLSLLLTQRAREIAELAEARTVLAESRGRLVAQALDAEDTARRRLAEALHDEALQNVLAARHELGAEGARVDLVSEALDRTVRQLREAVFDLHPYLLEHAGLGAALRAVAERAGVRAGFRVTVESDRPAEGVHDQLLFSVGRELIANAAKHAGAEALVVSLRRADGAVELTVSDDGRGIDPQVAEAAPRHGHIGLASLRERVDAAGGTLAVRRGPDGHGTVATARLPVPAAG